MRTLLAATFALGVMAVPTETLCYDCWRSCYIAGSSCGFKNCLCACAGFGDCECFKVYTPYDRLMLEAQGWRFAP